MGKLDLEAAASLPTMLEEEGDQEEGLGEAGEETEAPGDAEAEQAKPAETGEETEAAGEGTEAAKVSGNLINLTKSGWVLL